MYDLIMFDGFNKLCLFVGEYLLSCVEDSLSRKYLMCLECTPCLVPTDLVLVFSMMIEIMKGQSD